MRFALCSLMAGLLVLAGCEAPEKTADSTEADAAGDQPGTDEHTGAEGDVAADADDGDGGQGDEDAGDGAEDMDADTEGDVDAGDGDGDAGQEAAVEDCNATGDEDNDGKLDCADTDCYYARQCACSCDTDAQCNESCACDPECLYACTSLYLSGANDGEYGKKKGINEGEEACFVEWTDLATRSAFKTFKIMRCVNGQLVEQDNCLSYFLDGNVTTSQVYCAPDDARTPYGSSQTLIHCMPGTSTYDCDFYGVAPGATRCFRDARTSDTRLRDAHLMVKCFHDVHPSAVDLSLYNQVNPTSGATYASFVDCSTPAGSGEGGGFQFHLPTAGECGLNTPNDTHQCLPLASDVDFGYIRDGIDDFVADSDFQNSADDFPDTQNIVTCNNPTAENGTAYVQLDTLGQLYTDYDRLIYADPLAARHANGVKYLNYSGFWGPETRPGLGWYDAGYQYGYWDDVLGIEVVPRECWDVDGDGFTNLYDNCPTVYNPDQADSPEVRGGGGIDRDGLGDACDPDFLAWYINKGELCSTNPNGYTCGTPTLTDIDGDGLEGAADTCPVICNPLEANGYQAFVDKNNQALTCADVAATYCPANCHTNPFNYAGCFSVSEADWDGDGKPNDTDDCPRVCNPAGEAGAEFSCSQCDRVTGSVINDYDGDGANEDNCPTVFNPEVDVPNSDVDKQPDEDNDGIGDACDDHNYTDDTGAPASAGDCNDHLRASSVVRINYDNMPVGSEPTDWTWDMCRPEWLAITKKWAELFIDTGVDGTTWDVASTGGCYSDEAVARFRRWVARIASDGNGTSPYYGLYAQAAAEIGSVAAGQASSVRNITDGNFSIRAYRNFAQSTPAGQNSNAWDNNSSMTAKLWSYYENELVDEILGEVAAHAQAYAQSKGKTYLGFYNNGTGVRWNHHKQLPGSETFVVPRHPTSGASYGFADEGMAWPLVTLEYLYDLHQSNGKRFWNWTLPYMAGDDRVSLYVAEAIANGGIVQAGGCGIEFIYADSNHSRQGYFQPNFTARAEFADVLQFFSDNFEYTGLARDGAQVGVYWSDNLEICGEENVAPMMYQGLRALHYTTELIAGGPFQMMCACDPNCGISDANLTYCGCDDSGSCDRSESPARPPTLAELAPNNVPKHDFIVVPVRALSAAERAVFEAYADLGGKVVVMPQTGDHDEWCAATSSWHENNSSENNNGAFIALTGAPLAGVSTSYFGANADPQAGGVGAKGWWEAFEYVAKPNHDVDLRNENNRSVNVLAIRDLLYTRTREALDAIAAPELAFAAQLPRSVHVSAYVKSGTPVWHLVNYAMTAEKLASYMYGEAAGGAQEYTSVEVGRAAPLVDVSVTLPVPASLQAGGGKVVVRTNGTAADPWSLAAEVEYNFGAGTTATILLDMNQWAIIFFRP